MAEGVDRGAVPPVAGLDSGKGFKALVELSPDAVFVILDDYHVFANARGLALLGGRTLADLQTRRASEFMDPECRPAARERMDIMIVGRSELEYVEERVIRLDGATVDIEAAGMPIEVDGKPAALVVVRDITARKQAEAALHAAQARFGAAFRSAPNAIVLVDLNGRIVTANPQLNRLTGCSDEELSRQACWDVAVPEDRDAVRASFEMVADGRCRAVGGDFRSRRADGSTGWVHARANRVAEEPLVAVHLMDVTASRLTQHQLADQARQDPLTGLDNRGSVLARLAAALDIPGQDVSVLFCDLDGFKGINDRYGHAVGDEVLIVVSRRMRAVVAVDDPMGRIGGDEFAVLLAGRGADVNAARVAERIRQVVAEPVGVRGHVLRVGVSIGIANGRSGTVSAEDLLAAADAAMYREKAAARRENGTPEAG
jgi:diguanylate cyclase (GGDEF)-like protein/PAS domain S-box-containing protein